MPPNTPPNQMVKAEDAANDAFNSLLIDLGSRALMALIMRDPEIKEALRSKDAGKVLEKLRPLRNDIAAKLKFPNVTDSILEHLARHLVSLYDATEEAQDGGIMGTILGTIGSVRKNLPVILAYRKGKK